MKKAWSNCRHICLRASRIRGATDHRLPGRVYLPKSNGSLLAPSLVKKVNQKSNQDPLQGTKVWSYRLRPSNGWTFLASPPHLPHATAQTRHPKKCLHHRFQLTSPRWRSGMSLGSRTPARDTGFHYFLTSISKRLNLNTPLH